MAAATAATKANTVAIAANDNALRRANAQRTNLLFQLQDIGVSLASGMNPLMVAAQQGSQISMIYGPEEGGLGRALQETGKMAVGLVMRLWPIGLAVGAGAAAVAGMRYEIEQTSGVAVSFGDVFQASIDVIVGGIYSGLQPAIQAISPWFAETWDGVVSEVKATGNAIIGVFVGAYNFITTGWSDLPTYFGGLGKQAWNALMDGLSGEAVTWTNPFTQEVIPLLKLDLSSFKAELSEAEQGAFAGTFGEAFGRDYMGEFFGVVQQQAVQNYNDRLDETGGTARRAAQGLNRTAAALGGADEAAKAFKETLNFGRETFGSFVGDLRSGLAEGEKGWAAFGNAAANALDRIADRALGLAADGLFNMLVGSFLPGFGQTGGAWNGGLWGSAIFNAHGNVYPSPALAAYRNTVVDKPTPFAFAKGAGIMDEAGAEAILPLARMPSGDLGVQVVPRGGTSNQVVVNVYNQSSSRIQTRERKGTDGRREMEIFVLDTVREARRRGKAGF